MVCSTTLDASDDKACENAERKFYAYNLNEQS